MIYLIAEIKANLGHEQNVQKGLTQLLNPTRKEVGCCQYELFEDQNIAGLFLMQETWSSQPDLNKHLASQHLQQFVQQCEQHNALEYMQIRHLRFIA